MSIGLLAIDPGLTGTGWAWWQNAYTPIPTSVGVILVREPKQWWIRAAMITAQLKTIPQDRVARLVVEFPEYHESSGRQLGWRSGDLQKLTFLVGMIAGINPGTFLPVGPNAWKGQLPKHVVQSRIETRFGKDVCARLGIRTHAWDAVGIGLWFLDTQLIKKYGGKCREANQG